MAERAKRIQMYDENKFQNINPETLKLFQKYQIDMSIRDLSKNTIDAYNADLKQWFIFMYDHQFNLSVLEATEDDITEYYYWRKQQGNNVNRQKRVMASISAFYKFLRKKKLIRESPTEFIDRPKAGQPITVQTYLTKEQVQLMREKLEEYGDIQLQAYAFLSLTTMARVNAVANLKWKQVNLEERICTDVIEKEGKIVELSFSVETKNYLENLIQYRKENNIDAGEIRKAAHKAYEELQKTRNDIRLEGERVLKWMADNNKRGIVLAGRPYHIDPEINHGIPELITSYDIAVLSEDSISHLGKVDRPTIAMDQWMYHSRLYAAASFVRTQNNLDMIQLNSFGCGLDAVTTDQVNDILTSSNKICTVLKIDEVNNLGAARIRIRSLISAVKDRERKGIKSSPQNSAYKRVEFTKEMRKSYTILAPQMSPIHFDILMPALAACGYNLVQLPTGVGELDYGLKYVNNDACYPSLLVVGQFMKALLSGEYDLNKTALIITQTGGGCRATNYIGFIRRALKKAGMEQIPVISLSAGVETNSGFDINYRLLKAAIHSLIYGDLFMRVVYRTRPYEKVPGSVNALHDKWKKVCIEAVKKPKQSELKKNIRQIVKEFDEIELDETKKKPRVGIVGEILVKYLPAANNHVVELLEAEGAEAVCPDMLDFFMYSAYDSEFKADHLGFKKTSKWLGNAAIWLLNQFRKPYCKALAESKRFEAPPEIHVLAKYAEPFVSNGNQTGEGWFLTGEMIELIHSNVPNIVCTQPFGCLPNHVVGKGVIKQIRKAFPDANIVAVDYDPGASEVNQLNRIKLMLATANENLNK